MKKKIKNIELTVNEVANVKKISFVQDPALESSFMYFNKGEYSFVKTDVEKRIVTGLAMRANKKIPRVNKKTGEEYTVSFSPETVRLASELYLKDGNQEEANLEHKYTIDGVCLVESYIITDARVNNAVALGFDDVQEFDWWVSLKVYNDELWENFIKTGQVTGFSIEGQFVDAIVHMNEEGFKCHDECEDEWDIIKLMTDNAHDYDKLKVIVDGYLEFGIWPPLHPNCVCRIVDGVWILHPEDSMAGPCPICKERADSFNSQPRTGSIRKKPLNMSVENLKTGVAHYTEDGELWTGPTHKDADGRLMTGAVHSTDSQYLYHLEDLATIGPRGGVKESDKAPKSNTPNKNPEGRGTSKGDSSTTRGSEVPKAVEESLKKKADEFNEKYKEKLGYGANVGMLKSVYQRGVGAFTVSHSPKVSSSQQWAYARVNAFLYIIKNGRPENPKYVNDNDLLPKKHPKSEKFAEESYDDYPQEAVENAKRALRYAEEYGWGSCGTPVGKARANQLAKGEPISRETIARMSAFERQRENSDRELGDGCGRLMWLAWGGDAGVEWAARKLEQIDREEE